MGLTIIRNILRAHHTKIALLDVANGEGFV